MIEILILYIIHKREKTIYSIRKEIIELFGFFTEPSIGTVHPALRRLLIARAVELNERMSEGGKKSSYYSITKKGYEVFKEYFFSTSRENPSLFHTQMLARLATLGMLNIEEKERFIAESYKKIEKFMFDIDARLKDEFISLDYYQTQLLKKTNNDFKLLKEYLKNLKVD